MQFIGRSADLSFLEKCYAKRTAQLVFLYGRRRVGKTEALRQFSQNKPCIWYSCTKDPDALQLRSFSQRLLVHAPGLSRHIDAFASWQDAFEAIPDLDINGKKLVIIDEFPYAAQGNSALPSILQNAWDQTLSREDVMIVLCGSSISFMEDELLGEKNPLFGRATGVWKMQPLSFSEAVDFFPNMTPQSQLETYGILGGIPHYLQQFDPELSVAQNVKDTILSRGSALYTEVDFLLRQELREPMTYNAILRAVATGETELNGIAQKTLLDNRVAHTYLKKLEALHIIEREFSVQAGEQERAKASRGLWRIKDNFTAFWFAAAHPWQSELDMGDVDGVWQHSIEPSLNHFLSYSFEEICKQWLVQRNISGDLPQRYRAIGRWWNKAEEIDIVALGEKGDHLLAECKFKNAPMDVGVLRDLQRKDALCFKTGESWTWLFSKNGFTDNGAWAAHSDRVRLIDAGELAE